MPNGYAAAHLPMLALTDLMTPICSLDGSPLGHVEEVGIVTGAPVAELGAAQWILAADPAPTKPYADALRGLAGGSPLSPESGAVICQQVTTIGDEPGADPAHELRLTLTGPGIARAIVMYVSGLAAAYFRERAELCAAHPVGIDLILIASDGAIAAIPRTTEIVSVTETTPTNQPMETYR